MSALQKHLQKAKLPPVCPLSTTAERVASGGGAGPRRAVNFGRKRDYSPVGWEEYYDSEEDIKISNGNVFKVYRWSGAGGGTEPLLVFLHGGGYSGLTWALLTSQIVKLVECQVAAIDLRGHGSSKTTDDSDLCAETMSSDVGQVLEKMLGEDDAPPIVLVGHSMGGAIAVHTAHRRLVPSLLGLVVIDVVEGTAMDALQSMQSFLRGRPSSFRSIEDAIEWCVRSGQVRNLESAKVSMPGQIRNLATGDVATLDFKQQRNIEMAIDDSSSRTPALHHGNSIPEEAEEEDGDERDSAATKKTETDLFKVPSHSFGENMNYTWRIDLSKTEKYWTGWFQGLSNMFLSCPVAKMLLLAGIDRLDKDLTIGQMQGKFQMQVLPQCGHAVHEDVPDKVADVIAAFLVRNKFARSADNFQIMFPGC